MIYLRTKTPYTGRAEGGWHGPRPVRKDPILPSYVDLFCQQLLLVVGVFAAALALIGGAIYLLTLILPEVGL